MAYNSSYKQYAGRKRRFQSRGRYTPVARTNGGRYNGSKGFVSTVKRVVRTMSEVKYSTRHQAYSGDVTLNPLIEITPFTSVGTNKYQRIGSHIKSKFLTCKLVIVMEDNASQPEVGLNFVRVALLQGRAAFDDPVNTPSYSLSTLLDDSTQPFMSTFRGQNVRVIRDTILPMGATPHADQSQLPAARYKKFSIKLGNNVNFSGTPATLPNEPKDRYFLYFATPINIVGTLTMVLDMFTRLSFIDI